MSPETLAALLVEHARAALVAVPLARIAGPRMLTVGGSARLAITGEGVAQVLSVGRGDLFGFGPGAVGVHSTPGESLPGFEARIDALWRDAGWTLVDEVANG